MLLFVLGNNAALIAVVAARLDNEVLALLLKLTFDQLTAPFPLVVSTWPLVPSVEGKVYAPIFRVPLNTLLPVLAFTANTGTALPFLNSYCTLVESKNKP